MALGFHNHPFLSRGDPLLEGLERDARYAALLREMEQRWLEFEP